MVMTTQKPIVVMQNIKRKDSNHITEKQVIKEDSKGGKTKTKDVQKKQKTNYKIAVLSPYPLINYFKCKWVKFFNLKI
jgi:hypothetical protein